MSTWNWDEHDEAAYQKRIREEQENMFKDSPCQGGRRALYVRDMTYRLDDLAMAFSRTGNKTVADELSTFAEEVRFQMEAIDRYDSKMLMERVTESGRSTINMIAGVLAGAVAIGGKEELRPLAEAFIPKSEEG